MSTDFVSKSASVKVMRSFDYCHFEINIGLNNEGGLTLAEIDSARKEAARLADKAVEQYKIAKRVGESVEEARRHVGWDSEEAARIRAIAETDRTDSEKATLKRWDDAVFASNRRYDYEDDYEEQP